MSWLSRFLNVFRGDRLTRDIDSELQSHLDEAIEEGRDPQEARAAFGPVLRIREESRDLKLIPWLESLGADARCGWRQVRTNGVTSAVAVLSLGLAIGACGAAFRIVDAFLWRPLPVNGAERLFVVSRRAIDPSSGAAQTYYGCEYPLFRLMREAIAGQAELIAISAAARTDVTFGRDADFEKAYRQYVSGWMFDTFGVGATLGRVLTANDDRLPGAHPVAVLSHDYWTRRFGRDPAIVGRVVRIGRTTHEIVGVAEQNFTGTDPGIITDIFVPSTMNPAVGEINTQWTRTFARLAPGVSPESVRDTLQPVFRVFQTERAGRLRGLTPSRIDELINSPLQIESAAAGVSALKRTGRWPLTAMAILAFVVLLVACTTVANLMTARAAAREREMALRVSIGAGRWRLVQLMLIESGWIALIASALGAAVAWWVAPFMVSRINPPDDPARLVLSIDWRVAGFSIATIIGVASLLGLIPAFRASIVTPAGVLKTGGTASHRRLMHALIGVQAAFCVLVIFMAGMVVTSFVRLTRQPTGFSRDGLITVDVVAQPAQPTNVWEQMTETLRAVPGVQMAALAGQPMLAGYGRNTLVSIDGSPPSDVLGHFVSISPGWLNAMGISVVDGRDFRDGDKTPGVALVSEEFARQFFGARNPIGHTFEQTMVSGMKFQIVGLVQDVRYQHMRDPILPMAYVPFQSVDAQNTWRPNGQGTFAIKVRGGDPLSLAPQLRRAVTEFRSGFRVAAIRTQEELIAADVVRDRLLAMLGLFFAGIALLLGGIGMYGVLHYSVLQRRRDIGIRVALGARVLEIVHVVTAGPVVMLLVGSIVGVASGLAVARYLETLFFEVKATDPAMIALPFAAMVAATIIAAAAPVLRALAIDPRVMLRVE